MKRTIVACAAAAAIAAAPRPYLAKVNGEPITAADLRSEFVRRHGGHQKFLGGADEVRQFLNLVVDARLLVQEAYRLDLQHDPEIEAAAAERAARASIDRLATIEIEDKAQPTEEEIRTAWSEKTREMIEARQIAVASREEAERVRTRILAGESFEHLARTVSIAPSRQLGGYLPLVGWGTMEPAWEEAVWPLCPGEVSDVFKTSTGFEVVQVGARNPFPLADYGKCHSRIEGILKRRKLEERKRALSELLWTRYDARFAGVALHPAALEQARRDAPERPLATWRGGTLSVAEGWSAADAQEIAALPPGRADEETAERIRSEVNERLARLEARARHLELDPAVADPVRRYREDLMEGALYERYVLKDVTVTDGEVRAYYDTHAAEWVSPEKRRVAHVVVKTREEADDVRAKALAGEAFEDLVRARSTDATSVKDGGNLGWITAKDVPPGFESVLTLAEGAISEPIASKFGFHIVKVGQVVPAQPLTFASAEPDVRKLLLDQRRREKRRDWVQKLRAAAKVAFDDGAIRELARAQAAAVAAATN
jgi:parvulin-like peptidyl-prolyl isomerase